MLYAKIFFKMFFKMYKLFFYKNIKFKNNIETRYLLMQQSEFTKTKLNSFFFREYQTVLSYCKKDYMLDLCHKKVACLSEIQYTAIIFQPLDFSRHVKNFFLFSLLSFACIWCLQFRKSNNYDRYNCYCYNCYHYKLSAKF